MDQSTWAVIPPQCHHLRWADIVEANVCFEDLFFVVEF
jgi:hypothetical protein